MTNKIRLSELATNLRPIRQTMFNLNFDFSLDFNLSRGYLRHLGAGLVFVLASAFWVPTQAQVRLPAEHWFETFKQEASQEDLYRLLYNMPKGGDLHNHLSGSSLPVWWYEAAIAEIGQGYRYYTKVRINNCQPYGNGSPAPYPYHLLFLNLLEANWQVLSDCEKGEYKTLEELTREEKDAWLRSIELDKAHEGREEFFSTHWQRLNDLYRNPFIIAALLVRNMAAFGEEGLLYLETQTGAEGFLKPDGTYFEPDEVVDIYKQTLAGPEAVATGVTVRLQESLVRFLPDAESTLARLYMFVAKHPALYVGVNIVGREDNSKGHPKRFLPTLRKLRRQQHVRLAIHAGEMDMPNYNVRNTLLLGADRIGHALNLTTDEDSMRLMRNNRYLVEINLISNLLLEYVDSYDQHPFPEYLRTDIPVALSTDDRGMWSSNMTDEFFVAVTEFNLTWAEILLLSRNSIQYGFMEEGLKERLLRTFNNRAERFEKRFLVGGLAHTATKTPVNYNFLCRIYNLCTFQQNPDGQ